MLSAERTKGGRIADIMEYVCELGRLVECRYLHWSPCGQCPKAKFLQSLAVIFHEQYFGDERCEVRTSIAIVCHRTVGVPKEVDSD